MKAPAFAYAAPTSVEAAIEALATDGDARVIAGGQSLLPLLVMRLAYPAVLVDLGKAAGLDGIEMRDGAVTIGAMTTQRALERSPVIAERLPLLSEAASWIAHAAIRNRGTLGGSLAHADPAAELPAAMLALDAVLHVRGPAGARDVAAEDFWIGPFTTALEPGELLVGVTMPSAPGGWSFQEVARRSGDFALALVACRLERAGDVCREARIAGGAVGPTPVRLRAAEELLAGRAVDDELAAEAAGKAASGVSPASDVHGSAEYRRQLVRTLVERAILEAWRRTA